MSTERRVSARPSPPHHPCPSNLAALPRIRSRTELETVSENLSTVGIDALPKQAFLIGNPPPRYTGFERAAVAVPEPAPKSREHAHGLFPLSGTGGFDRTRGISSSIGSTPISTPVTDTSNTDRIFHTSPAKPGGGGAPARS